MAPVSAIRTAMAADDLPTASSGIDLIAPILATMAARRSRSTRSASSFSRWRSASHSSRRPNRRDSSGSRMPTSSFSTAITALAKALTSSRASLPVFWIATRSVLSRIAAAWHSSRPALFVMLVMRSDCLTSSDSSALRVARLSAFSARFMTVSSLTSLSSSQTTTSARWRGIGSR